MTSITDSLSVVFTSDISISTGKSNLSCFSCAYAYAYVVPVLTMWLFACACACACAYVASFADVICVGRKTTQITSAKEASAYVASGNHALRMFSKLSLYGAYFRNLKDFDSVMITRKPVYDYLSKCMP